MNDAEPHLLTWTAKEPNQRGWWWAQSAMGARKVVQVSEKPSHRTGMLWVDLGAGNWWPVPSAMLVGWRWAGPLPEPLEPLLEATRQNSVINKPSSDK